MQIVSGAVLERWNGLSDEQVVHQVLDGQTATAAFAVATGVILQLMLNH